MVWAQKSSPVDFATGLPSILALRPLDTGQGDPLKRSKQVVASRWDTRRWSTGITTILAYMTIVQQTTSFFTGCWRLRRSARGRPSGRVARRAACWHDPSAAL